MQSVTPCTDDICHDVITRNEYADRSSRHDDMDDGLTAVRAVWIAARGDHGRHDFDILLTCPYKVLSQTLAHTNTIKAFA